MVNDLPSAPDRHGAAMRAVRPSDGAATFAIGGEMTDEEFFAMDDVKRMIKIGRLKPRELCRFFKDFAAPDSENQEAMCWAHIAAEFAHRYSRILDSIGAIET